MKRIFLSLLAIVCAVVLMAQPKYVFYFIGDGMGQNQVLLTEMYLAQLKGEIGRKQLVMTQFPVAGAASTFSKSNSITDSSAAGTCLASGVKTTNGTLGLDKDGKHHTTIAETLHKQGWNVGITTSVSIDHATPGAFYAATEKRSNYYTIGRQLINSDFEFFGGSTFLKPVNTFNDSDPNLYAACDAAKYQVCHGVKELEEVASKAEKVILIPEKEGFDRTQPGPGHLAYAIDRDKEDLTLEQITQSAIRFLSKREKPFFLMVEGGQIDWSCHGNDIATTIHEVMDFDRAIEAAYHFYLEHPEETLIVITADHETGGLALGNSDYTLHLDLLQHQKASSGVISAKLGELHKKHGKKLSFEQVKSFLSYWLGLFSQVEVTAQEEAALKAAYKLMMKNKLTDSKNMYASLNALSDMAVQLLTSKAHVAWTTRSHSAAAVPVYAIGNGAEYFTGFYDNSDIAPRMHFVATQAELHQGNPLPDTHHIKEMKPIILKKK